MDLTHHFLLSMPTLADSWFDKSITYIFEHNESGAIGFVINRHTHMMAGDIYDQLKIDCTDKHCRGVPIFQGGPVDGERGFILCDSTTLPTAADNTTAKYAGDATNNRSDADSDEIACSGKVSGEISDNASGITSDVDDAADADSEHQIANSYNVNKFGIGVSSSIDSLTELAVRQGPDSHLLLLGYAGWAAGQLEAEIASNSWLTCEATTDIIFHDNCDDKFTLAAKSIGVDFSLISGDAGHA